jgi:hypothetical protein
MLLDKLICPLALTLLWQTLKKGTAIHVGTGSDIPVAINFLLPIPVKRV